MWPRNRGQNKNLSCYRGEIKDNIKEKCIKLIPKKGVKKSRKRKMSVQSKEGSGSGKSLGACPSAILTAENRSQFSE